MKPLMAAMLWVAVTGAAAQREAAPIRVLVDTDAGRSNWPSTPRTRR
jgi:hypothetical protein